MNAFKRCSVCNSGFCEATLPTSLLPDKCPNCITPEEIQAWLDNLPEQFNRGWYSHWRKKGV